MVALPEERVGATTAAAVKVAGDRVAIGDLGLRSFGGFEGMIEV